MAKQGFFQAGTFAAKAPEALVARCGACGLHQSCQSPKMEPNGQGRKGILVVGESPSATDDARAGSFADANGDRLRQELWTLGVDLDRDCWQTNATICHDKEREEPTSAQVDHCRPNLTKTINHLKPSTVILLGDAPVRSLIGRVWKDDPGGIDRWAGWRIPDQTINAHICPTWTAAYVARYEERNPAQVLWWRRHLAAAVALSGHPWPDGAPDYAAGVRVLYRAEEAADALAGLLGAGNPVSFDFETTTLKPDGPAARIVCCAVSDGETTIAYPWHGAAIAATRDLLWSPVPKIGFNSKFETRWTIKEFGKGVRNWVWCGMLAAHVLDNRPGVSGLAFQSYVRLGYHNYKADMKPYLTSDGSNTPNRIREVALGKLLLYCGEDALIEHIVAKHQMAEMGVEL